VWVVGSYVFISRCIYVTYVCMYVCMHGGCMYTRWVDGGCISTRWGEIIARY
jgi:hypothetical protein